MSTASRSEQGAAEPGVVRLAGGEERRAGELLGRAFFDDPGYAYIIPREHARRGEVVDWLCTLGVRLGLLCGQVTRSEGELRNVLVGFPPGTYPASVWQQIRAGALLAPFKLPPAALGRFLHWLMTLERHHQRNMPRPHWYVFLLGVEPSAQGQGLGGALLWPALREADAAGVPCYLETFNPSNLPFYRRHGFEVLDALELAPGGPPFWTMRRPPASHALHASPRRA